MLSAACSSAPTVLSPTSLTAARRASSIAAISSSGPAGRTGTASAASSPPAPRNFDLRGEFRRGLLAAATELRHIARVARHPASQLAHADTAAVHGRGERFGEVHAYNIPRCLPVGRSRL